MSNFIKTDQTQGECDEEISKTKALCKTNKDCQNLGAQSNSWNGILILFLVDKKI